jgi:hypothetical protein
MSGEAERAAASPMDGSPCGELAAAGRTGPPTGPQRGQFGGGIQAGILPRGPRLRAAGNFWKFIFSGFV